MVAFLAFVVICNSQAPILGLILLAVFYLIDKHILKDDK